MVSGMPCSASSPQSSTKRGANSRSRPTSSPSSGSERCRRSSYRSGSVATRRSGTPCARWSCVCAASPRWSSAYSDKTASQASGGLPNSRTDVPASARRSQARSSSWPSTSATRSGHRAKSPTVSRGSNACTGLHALNQAAPPASGTRSTVAHGRSCAVSIAPTGSTCARIQSSAAARFTLELCAPGEALRPVRRCGRVRAMVPEAPLESTEQGLVPKGDGWFVLNAREARWRPGEGRGAYCVFEGEPEFSQVGIHLVGLAPGEPMSMYHWEADQEDFLVLAGEALLIVEGEERPLRQWDFVHCPAGTNHVIVGAGDGPSVVLAVGARDQSTGPDWGAYTVDEAALRRGAGVEQETIDQHQAYAPFSNRQPTRYREGWLHE